MSGVRAPKTQPSGCVTAANATGRAVSTGIVLSGIPGRYLSGHRVSAQKSRMNVFKGGEGNNKGRGEGCT